MKFLKKIFHNKNIDIPNKPLIFIAAMPRSGSTLLSGILSNDNDSFIFNEIKINRGIFLESRLLQSGRLNVKDLRLLKAKEGNPDKMVQSFMEILPKLQKQTPHIGIKECFIENWELLNKYHGNIKYIILARNPKDIMLSVLDYGEKVEWHKKMWADKGDAFIANTFNDIWREQKSIYTKYPDQTLLIKYESLCINPKEVISQICTHIESKDIELTNINSHIKSVGHRNWEVEKHGSNISKSSVNSFSYETNRYKLERANNLYKLMHDYVSFWNY